MLEQIMDRHLLLWAMALTGVLGAVGMFATHLSYRRMIKKSGHLSNLKEKWLNLWKTRDKLIHRMNRLVWYPALLGTVFLGISVFLNSYMKMEEGLPVTYLYVGSVVPVALMLLRHALDFSYQEELIMNSLADYIEKVRIWIEEFPETRKPDQAMAEDVVEKITASIRQTAATGSHFSKMLSPEEEQIMREIIREFIQS